MSWNSHLLRGIHADSESAQPQLPPPPAPPPAPVPSEQVLVVPSCLAPCQWFSAAVHTLERRFCFEIQARGAFRSQMCEASTRLASSEGPMS